MEQDHTVEKGFLVFSGIPETFPKTIGRIVVIGQHETFSCGDDLIVARLAECFNASSFNLYTTAEAGISALKKADFSELGAVIVQDRLAIVKPVPADEETDFRKFIVKQFRDIAQTERGLAILRAYGEQWPVPKYLATTCCEGSFLALTPFTNG